MLGPTSRRPAVYFREVVGGTAAFLPAQYSVAMGYRIDLLEKLAEDLGFEFDSYRWRWKYGAWKGAADRPAGTFTDWQTWLPPLQYQPARVG
ncbi:glutamate receptor ionotropic, NMDA 3B [Lates japonicus]|uniref:Glutamate receptor ionotropic, NMDA 3B n=1 Tax=Lates japonicus TaxID=270547 RepID=A0AAD3NI54_LATJO|nr:glutamate receptor ionotropic, NMDA 3B [Lates japonicus]